MTLVRLLRAALACAAMLAATGCMFGPTARSFHPAVEPQGVRTSLQLMMKPWLLVGELLAVDDTALLVLRGANRDVTPPAGGAGPRIAHVPLQRISVGQFSQSGARIAGGRFVDADAFAEARLVSRYPQGVRPELLVALLGAYRQSTLEVLDAR